MELLYIVGGLIVLAFLWQGFTWLQDYRRRIRIRLEPVPPGPEHVDSFPELGKVRVRPRFAGEEASDDDEPSLGPVIVVGTRDRDDERAPRVTPSAVSPEGRAPAAAAVVAPRVEPAPVPVRAASPVPPVDEARQPDTAPVVAEPEATAVSGPAPASDGGDSAAGVDAPLPAAAVAPAAPREEPPVLVTPMVTPLPEAEQQDMFADQMIAPPPMPGRPRNRAQALYGTPPVEPVRPVRTLPEERPHVEVQDVIALHVVARQHPFNGEDLLRSILGFGLRFGDMSIFHRHERPTGQGKVLFSMAKAVEPGTFDLHAMSGEEIPGVTFFLSLPGVNSIHAYDIMVDTAKRLAIELQGEILDEQQQPLTRQLVEHYRERVQEFERRRLMQRPAH